MTDDYQRRSYGEISVGTGEKPGIVVVDFQLGFTDPQYPLGGAPLVMRAVENTARLLKVARRRRRAGGGVQHRLHERARDALLEDHGGASRPSCTIIRARRSTRASTSPPTTSR